MIKYDKDLKLGVEKVMNIHKRWHLENPETPRLVS